MTLEQFLNRIDGFYQKSSSDQIDYLLFYHIEILNEQGAKAKEIEELFDELHIPKYSNVGAYLGKFSKGSKQKFIKKSERYFLGRSRRTEIETEAGQVSTPEPSDDLFPASLLHDTRGYLIKIGSQASLCYDLGLYDASLVMVRKLIETLIIECFEKFSLENKIKGHDGHYFFLSDLIDAFKNESAWTLSRNTVQALPQIKKYGDLSAHNRRFSAKKPDLDKIKDDLRIVIDELIHLIDY